MSAYDELHAYARRRGLRIGLVLTGEGDRLEELVIRDRVGGEPFASRWIRKPGTRDELEGAAAALLSELRGAEYGS
jgi:hypothetical protein